MGIQRMSVYVEPCANHGWRLGPSCHLIADSLDELHEFAARIGMKREWFQNHKDLPHYDLTVKRRKEAVRLGAKEITRKELVAMIWAKRKENRYDPDG